MQKPFWNSAVPRFVDRDEILELARDTACRLAARHPAVLQVLLFGSFARKDYGVRSDLDLLIVLRESSKPFLERVGELMGEVSAYPTDIFPYTRQELESRIAAGDPFWIQALAEAIPLYPSPGDSANDLGGVRNTRKG